MAIRTIYGYDRYYKETEAGNESTQRIASNDRAFEVGYYKFTSIQPDGTTLWKENGTWKIFMDADASEKTDEAIFQSARPM